MNRKNMPLILMLTAGACTCIVTMVQAYSVLASLVALFAVMLLFYCLGNGVRLLLDRFDRQNEEKAKQEQEEFIIFPNIRRTKTVTVWTRQISDIVTGWIRMAKSIIIRI